MFYKVQQERFFENKEYVFDFELMRKLYFRKK